MSIGDALPRVMKLARCAAGSRVMTSFRATGAFTVKVQSLTKAIGRVYRGDIRSREVSILYVLHWAPAL